MTVFNSIELFFFDEWRCHVLMSMDSIDRLGLEVTHSFTQKVINRKFLAKHSVLNSHANLIHAHLYIITDLIIIHFDRK